MVDTDIINYKRWQNNLVNKGSINAINFDLACQILVLLPALIFVNIFTENSLCF